MVVTNGKTRRQRRDQRHPMACSACGCTTVALHDSTRSQGHNGSMHLSSPTPFPRTARAACAATLSPAIWCARTA
jgi:hypothetical protein